MNRTQIYLPKELRQEVDRLRAGRGESLGEYIRKATKEKVAQDKQKKTDLSKLAKQVIGSLKISDKKAQRWIKEIHQERRLSDERMVKRWEESFKKSKDVSSGH